MLYLFVYVSCTSVLCCKCIFVSDDQASSDQSATVWGASRAGGLDRHILTDYLSFLIK